MTWWESKVHVDKEKAILCLHYIFLKDILYFSVFIIYFFIFYHWQSYNFHVIQTYNFTIDELKLLLQYFPEAQLKTGLCYRKLHPRMYICAYKGSPFPSKFAAG